MRKWIPHAVVVCALCLPVAGWSLFAPDSVPEDFVQGHEQLKADSAAVEGEFVIYRIKKAMWDAFSKSPEELGIPIEHAGYVWREPERFRFDITEGGMQPGYSVAAEDDVLYELDAPHPGVERTLRIHARCSERGKLVESFYTHSIARSINALWSGGDMTYVASAKRRDTVLTSTSAGGYLLQSKDPAAAGVKAEFATSALHPFERTSASYTIGGSSAKAEIRVESTEVEGRLLPSRIITVSDFGADSYTEVVILRLKPLSKKSPIADPITPKTFDDLNATYSVMDVRENRRGLFE
ncbi:hypothetical protein [Rubinisphaera sp. JC750]|uniref:hypothetical protein n=1 Tax=Rubinisphaera sp. JC750 TaxID=2898658 RepID=UPI001F1E88E3|nr:hypothetical protein [Rubinisphaera sp. JC750]